MGSGKILAYFNNLYCIAIKISKFRCFNIVNHNDIILREILDLADIFMSIRILKSVDIHNIHVLACEKESILFIISIPQKLSS